MDIIQADYAALAQIARDFGQQMAAIEDVQGQIQRGYAPLQAGGWLGRGVAAFVNEMDGDVLPAIERLRQALCEGQDVTLAIAEIMRQAEEEAAAPFRTTGNGSPGGTNGAGAQITGSPGGTNGAGAQATGGANGSDSSVGSAVWDYLTRTFVTEAEHGGYFTLLKSDKDGARGLGYKYSADLFAPDALKWQDIGGSPIDGQIKFGAVGLKVGLGTDKDGNFEAGVKANIAAVQGKVEGVFGDETLAVTGGVRGEALSAEGFLGYRDGSLGAEAGVNLVSVEGEVGTNIAGYNVGVNGEIGLKFEIGASIGKNTRIKLGPFSLGISFGGAKD